MPNTIEESRFALQSTINKLTQAQKSMAIKGANTTLVTKRLQAITLALAILESAWQQQEITYSKQELQQTYDILQGLLPSIEKIYAKTADGTPQKTLLTRRLTALHLAIDTIHTQLIYKTICSDDF